MIWVPVLYLKYSQYLGSVQATSLSSHCGLTVGVVEWVILLADELVGLLFLLSCTVVHLIVFIQQFSTGKVLHDAGPKRVTQHIGGGAQTVPVIKRERMDHSGLLLLSTYWEIRKMQRHMLAINMLEGYSMWYSALCINNLWSCATSGLSEALQWHLGWHNHRPIPIKMTFSGNSQEPIHSNYQCYVLCGQSHRCQYDHHGNQASLRDACCSNAGSSCCDTEWAEGGIERRVKTFNKRKQTNSTCALLVGVVE